MSKKKVGIGIVVVLLIGGGIWAFSGKADPQVEKVVQLQQEVMQAPPEARRERWAELRTQMDQLTPQQRSQVFENMRAQGEQRMRQEISTYFALPPQERVAYLDKQIDEAEKRRKEMQSRRQNQGQRQGQRQVQGQGQGQAVGRQGAPGGNRGGGGGDRSQRRKQRLDRESSDDRAKRHAYFDDLNKRRKERGLPPLGGPGGRR